ncbi:hypothetical protein [Paenibacillus sp. A3]|uniref:hypothetical protein n=1 Tax=Paenibacillus sp. A3 TaxID=1337054 RepID=UPI001ED98790|nr:hypothetical protein [Paenibacillus sp. A3]
MKPTNGRSGNRHQGPGDPSAGPSSKASNLLNGGNLNVRCIDPERKKLPCYRSDTAHFAAYCLRQFGEKKRGGCAERSRE